MNILLLKTLFITIFITTSLSSYGQEKTSFTQKLFKKNKTGQTVKAAKIDSIKTIYRLVKSKLKKDKAKQQEIENLSNWYYAEIKKVTKESKLEAAKKKDIAKKPKVNKADKTVKASKKNKKHLFKDIKEVTTKKDKTGNKSLQKEKSNEINTTTKPLTKKVNKKKRNVFVDTLYFIAPIKEVNASKDASLTLTLPFRNEIEQPKYFSDKEIGEYVDYFSFNQWEVPTQPDEFIQKKIEHFPSILPLVFNDDVKQQIKHFTNSNFNRRWIEEILGKTDFYFPMYEQVFDQYGIPVEVKYLSVIESGLNPKATSPMGAKGLWQFMPGTAKQYKLKNNSLIDEARDPQKATRAAAAYLNNMYSEFHDWFLALAAYNCGPGNVRKAIRRTKEGPKDFWGIKKYLPRETRNYVPKFIAMIYILNNYEAHNLTPKALDYDLQKIDTIHVHQPINTNDLVKYCGIKKEHIKFLNPILKTSHTPPPNPTFVLKIPYSKLENVLYYRDEIMPKPQTVADSSTPNYGTGNLSGEFVHTIKKGENLDGISKQYGVTVSELKSWNGLSNHIIREGQSLYIYK